MADSSDLRDFAYSDMLPLGADDHRLPAGVDRGGVHHRGRGPEVLEGRAGGADPAHVGGHARHQPLPALRPPPAAPQHPRRPRGLGQRPLRGNRAAPERQHRGRRDPAHVPGHRHRGDHGPQGRAGAHLRRRRRSRLPGRVRHLPHVQPALLAARPARHVHGGQHPEQPARPDRDPLQAGRRLRAVLHGQGRRLGQQVVPLPEDQGPAQRAVAARLLRRDPAAARHGGLPALPPSAGGGRHLGGIQP